jgi:hypothetical protein
MLRPSRLFAAAAVVVLCVLLPTVARAENYAPTPQDIADIDRLTGDYYHALDVGEYRAAYAMQMPSLQAMMPFDRFVELTQQSASERGPAIARKRTGITWYLDPPDAPGPGLYVAVDFVSQHRTLADAGEYVVWFRAPGGREFKLMRHEQAAAMTPLAQADTPTPALAPLPEAEGNAIGYASVAEARAALTARKDARPRPMADGWFVVELPSENAVWTFAPPGHPAYPSVVKRFLVNKEGQVMLSMAALCQAGKTACDDLIRQFQAMNAKLGQSARDAAGAKPAAK